MGQKLARNRSISYGFRDIYLQFSVFRKNSRWPPKIEKNRKFGYLLRSISSYPVGQKFNRNRCISYGFRDTYDFLFSRKNSRWPPKIAKKSKIFAFTKEHLVLPCGSKIRSKSLYLLQFSRYLQFSVFRKNSRWPPKIEKNQKFLYLLRTIFYYPGVKNLIEIALSLTVFEIFAIFKIGYFMTPV